ncbi:hypothetical protein [Halomicronema sp. CCY15110]|uniref:hypothetical protein n=1 Tax=Halomicronema sp. CCY15110 TaxID=2767773 RepID=UPI00194FE30A
MDQLRVDTRSRTLDIDNFTRDTREIVGMLVGDRSQARARVLWQCLPPVYRQCAVCYSDFGEADQRVLPS